MAAPSAAQCRSETRCSPLRRGHAAAAPPRKHSDVVADATVGVRSRRGRAAVPAAPREGASVLLLTASARDRFRGGVLGDLIVHVQTNAQRQNGLSGRRAVRQHRWWWWAGHGKGRVAAPTAAATGRAWRGGLGGGGVGGGGLGGGGAGGSGGGASGGGGPAAAAPAAAATAAAATVPALGGGGRRRRRPVLGIRHTVEVKSDTPGIVFGCTCPPAPGTRQRCHRPPVEPPTAVSSSTPCSLTSRRAWRQAAVLISPPWSG